MLGFLVRRILQAAIVVLIVTVITFLLLFAVNVVITTIYLQLVPGKGA